MENYAVSKKVWRKSVKNGRNCESQSQQHKLPFFYNKCVVVVFADKSFDIPFIIF